MSRVETEGVEKNGSVNRRESLDTRLGEQRKMGV